MLAIIIFLVIFQEPKFKFLNYLLNATSPAAIATSLSELSNAHVLGVVTLS